MNVFCIGDDILNFDVFIGHEYISPHFSQEMKQK